MNYVPIAARTSTNDLAGTEEFIDDDEPNQDQEYEPDHFFMPLWDHANDDFSSQAADSQAPNDTGRSDDDVSKASNVDTQD